MRSQKIICQCVVGLGCLFMLGQVSFAQEDLSEFIDMALKQNPGIMRAYNAWQAEKQKVRSEGALSDPMLSYGHFGDEIQTRVGPQEYKVGVSQQLPFPGKLGLKAKAQNARANMQEQEYEAVKRDVIKQIKFVFADLFWVDRAIEINQEEKAILEDLESVAQSKYESNLIPQQDVIKLQIELSKIIQKLAMLAKNRQGLAAKMNSLLARPVGEPIGQVAALSTPILSHSLEKIDQMSRDSRQELKAAEFSVEAAQKERTLSKMDYLPNFTVGYEYTNIGGGTTTASNDGEDAWMAKISVNVPLWFNKNNSRIREKRLKLTAAEDYERDLENQVSFEVSDVYYQITAQKEIIDLYETALLPQSKQAFDASQTSFETGNIGFLDWLDTERTYLQTRLAYYKSVADYNKLLAQLERTVGSSVVVEQGGSK